MTEPKFVGGLVRKTQVKTYRESSQLCFMLIISDSCYSDQWRNIVRDNQTLALAVIAAGDGEVTGRTLVPALSKGEEDAFTYSLQTKTYKGQGGFLADRIDVAK